MNEKVRLLPRKVKIIDGQIVGNRIPLGCLASRISLKHLECGILMAPEIIKRQQDMVTSMGFDSIKLYDTWIEVHFRCYNPKATDYAYYGEKGVTVYLKWRTSFLTFCRDVGNPPTSLHSLERIDISRNYEPGNCQWVIT